MKTKLENKDVLHTETENEEKIKREEYNLFRRINTILKKKGARLCKSRQGSEYNNLGLFYILNYKNIVTYSQIKNLEELVNDLKDETFLYKITC